MKKYIFMTLVLLPFLGCSQKEATPVKTTSITSKNVTKHERVDSKVVTERTIETTTEFIPEHIRRSRIEVVKHY